MGGWAVGGRGHWSGGSTGQRRGRGREEGACLSLNRDPISKEQGAACAEHLRKSRGLQAGATLVWCGGSSAETTYHATPRGTQSKGPAPGALPAGEHTLAGCRDNPNVSLPLAVCLSSSQTYQLLSLTPWEIALGWPSGLGALQRRHLLLCSFPDLAFSSHTRSPADEMVPLLGPFPLRACPVITGSPQTGGAPPRPGDMGDARRTVGPAYGSWKGGPSLLLPVLCPGLAMGPPNCPGGHGMWLCPRQGSKHPGVLVALAGPQGVPSSVCIPTPPDLASHRSTVRYPAAQRGRQAHRPHGVPASPGSKYH